MLCSPPKTAMRKTGELEECASVSGQPFDLFINRPNPRLERANNHRRFKRNSAMTSSRYLLAENKISLIANLDFFKSSLTGNDIIRKNLIVLPRN